VLPRAASGRLFAPDWELRWRVLPCLGERRCRAVYLGQQDWCPERLRPRELNGLTPARGEAILWGQQTGRTPGEWVELRIPHRFRYPVPAAPAPAGGRLGVRAVLEVWSDGRGEPQLVRLCDLKSYTER
jgi:hypothetical protein